MRLAQGPGIFLRCVTCEEPSGHGSLRLSMSTSHQWCHKYTNTNTNNKLNSRLFIIYDGIGQKHTLQGRDMLKHRWKNSCTSEFLYGCCNVLHAMKQIVGIMQSTDVQQCFAMQCREHSSKCNIHSALSTAHFALCLIVSCTVNTVY